MNYIDKIRAELKKDFNENTFQKESFNSSLSPDGKFLLNITYYLSNNNNLSLTKVEIYDQEFNNKIFDFFVNYSSFFYGWLKKGSIDYLICAEDIFGGQTIIDLTNKQIQGYSPNEDGFIWTDFHLSPDGKILATIGCYWACPSEVKIFDFTNPMDLPLKELKEFELLDNDEIILGWTDNETLQMKGVKRKTEPEYFENGNFRMKVIRETNIERQIKINQNNKC